MFLKKWLQKFTLKPIRSRLEQAASVEVISYSGASYRSPLARRLVLVSIAVALTFFTCLPAALTLTEHGDESLYAWGGHYYLARIHHLDFARGTGSYQDPGWDPNTVWALTGPTMTRVYYGVAEWITRIPIPSVAYVWTGDALHGLDDPAQLGLDMHLKQLSLLTLRLAAIMAAAIGFGIFTYRLGFLGLVATLVMLAIPGVTTDLARAWAEGPLFLALGLCSLAFGTRWFGSACGLAVTFKLTAIGLWPLLLLPRASGPYRGWRWLGIATALTTFSVLTPPSWYSGGPLYLLPMALFRTNWYRSFSAMIKDMPGYVPPSPEVANQFGFFIPTRYLLPFEWIAALVVAYLLGRLFHYVGRPHVITPAKIGLA